MSKKLFDICIGNPPYQEETQGTSDTPVYNRFMDAVYDIADKVELITPARFLFDAGKTPKAWNKKMLNDPHLRVLWYEQVSSKVFSNTDIKGGVVVTYRNAQKIFGAIEFFTTFPELNSIRSKVTGRSDFAPINAIMYSSESYKFAEQLHTDFPSLRYRLENGNAVGVLSKGHDYDIVSNIFSKMTEQFLDCKPENGEEYVKFIGLVGNKRYQKWIKRKYVRHHDNLDYYKVILPKSNGSGAIGEVLSTPLLGEPLLGHTQSFISIGRFENKVTAENALKYVKSKFARTMLGILKVTQNNPPEKWKYVPLQDFTSSSDIDWSQPISGIDQQLYHKYGLTDEEITFIETHVKEMV